MRVCYGWRVISEGDVVVVGGMCTKSRGLCEEGCEDM